MFALGVVLALALVVVGSWNRHQHERADRKRVIAYAKSEGIAAVFVDPQGDRAPTGYESMGEL